MPIFFKHSISPQAHLAIWHITEPLAFFTVDLPINPAIHHPEKQLQHLASRYVITHLMPDFPLYSVEYDEHRKPHIPLSKIHFSFSHAGSYAVALVCDGEYCGVDIEMFQPKIESLKNKFLKDDEISLAGEILTLYGAELRLTITHILSLFFSAKEAIYKWQGKRGISIKRDIHILKYEISLSKLVCRFANSEEEMAVFFKWFPSFVVTWIVFPKF